VYSSGSLNPGFRDLQLKAMWMHGSFGIRSRITRAYEFFGIHSLFGATPIALFRTKYMRFVSGAQMVQLSQIP